MQKKLLNIFSFHHPLCEQLNSALAKRGVQVESISLLDKFKIQFWRAVLGTLFSFNKKIIFFHAMGLFNVILLLIFSVFSVNKKRVSVFWGSDFNLSNDRIKLRFRLVSMLSNRILFANEDMAARFVSSYGGSEKVRIIRFGLKTLEDIDQARGKLNHRREKKISVHVCSNSSPNQQTLEVIKSLEAAQEHFSPAMEIVFNLAYGNQEYKTKVLEALQHSNLQNVSIDTEFRGGSELAMHRIDSDILINVQKADMLSGAMQEVLYSGNKVIVGSWLNYDCLTEKGCHLYKVDQVKNVGLKVAEVFKSLPEEAEKVSSNRAVIGSMSLWDNASGTWLGVIDELYS